MRKIVQGGLDMVSEKAVREPRGLAGTEASRACVEWYWAIPAAEREAWYLGEQLEKSG